MALDNDHESGHQGLAADSVESGGSPGEVIVGEVVLPGEGPQFVEEDDTRLLLNAFDAFRNARGGQL